MFNLVKDYVERFLRDRGWSGIGTDRVICLDVTNRLIDGYCYLFGGAERFPRIVVKAARTAAGKSVFETEFETLEGLESAGMNDERRTTPEPLGLHREGEVLITVQSALPGAVMKNMPASRLFSAARSEASVGLVTTWWRRFQDSIGTRKLLLDEATYAREVLGHVVRFRNRYLLDQDERDLLAARFEVESGLRGLVLPFMARHADFCTANMVLEDGELGVFDWEFPLEHQSPLFDLFFFFSSVRFPFVGYRGESDHFRSLIEVYWGESYFSRVMRRQMRAVCEEFEVPVEILPDLLLLSLIQVANMKYEAMVLSHRLDYEELPDGEATDQEKTRRWSAFRQADKNVPFASIRRGRLMSINEFVRRGSPRF